VSLRHIIFLHIHSIPWTHTSPHSKHIYHGSWVHYWYWWYLDETCLGDRQCSCWIMYQHRSGLETGLVMSLYRGSGSCMMDWVSCCDMSFDPRSISLRSWYWLWSYDIAGVVWSVHGPSQTTHFFQSSVWYSWSIILSSHHVWGHSRECGLVLCCYDLASITWSSIEIVSIYVIVWLYERIEVSRWWVWITRVLW